MNWKARGLAVCLALALSACGPLVRPTQPPPPTPASPPPPAPAGTWVQADCPDPFTPKGTDFCAGNSCFIWVQVVWNATTRACEVVAGTTEMRVLGKQGDKLTMRWLLPDSANFEFQMEPPPPPPYLPPIIFKAPNNQFSNPKVTKKKVELDNAYTEKGPFAYGIRVYHSTKGKLESDPSLYNDF
jgi:hypothetical protein